MSQFKLNKVAAVVLASGVMWAGVAVAAYGPAPVAPVVKKSAWTVFAGYGQLTPSDGIIDEVTPSYKWANAAADGFNVADVDALAPYLWYVANAAGTATEFKIFGTATGTFVYGADPLTAGWKTVTGGIFNTGYQMDVSPDGQGLRIVKTDGTEVTATSVDGGANWLASDGTTAINKAGWTNAATTLSSVADVDALNSLVAAAATAPTAYNRAGELEVENMKIWEAGVYHSSGFGVSFSGTVDSADVTLSTGTATTSLTYDFTAVYLDYHRTFNDMIIGYVGVGAAEQKLMRDASGYEHDQTDFSAKVGVKMRFDISKSFSAYGNLSYNHFADIDADGPVLGFLPGPTLDGNLSGAALLAGVMFRT